MSKSKPLRPATRRCTACWKETSLALEVAGERLEEVLVSRCACRAAKPLHDKVIAGVHTGNDRPQWLDLYEHSFRSCFHQVGKVEQMEPVPLAVVCHTPHVECGRVGRRVAVHHYAIPGTSVNAPICGIEERAGAVEVLVTENVVDYTSV